MLKPPPQGLHGLHETQTRSIGTRTTAGAQVLHTGAGAQVLQTGAQEPQAAFAAVVPVAMTLKRAIADNKFFIVFSPKC
jgi:hypothetical protein